MIKETTKIKKHGNSQAILIPARLRNDSQFPFKMDEELTMEINKKGLMIRRKNE